MIDAPTTTSNEAVDRLVAAKARLYRAQVLVPRAWHRDRLEVAIKAIDSVADDLPASLCGSAPSFPGAKFVNRMPVSPPDYVTLAAGAVLVAAGGGAIGALVALLAR